MIHSVSEIEFQQGLDWLKTLSSDQPPQSALIKILENYLVLLKQNKNSLENLKLLRQEMGFIPKSEKGSLLKHGYAV
jgi:hypothetical protein